MDDFQTEETGFEGTGGGKFEDSPEISSWQSIAVSEPETDIGESDGRGSSDIGGAADGDYTGDNVENGDSEGIAESKSIEDDGEQGNNSSATSQGDSAESQSGQLSTQGVENSQTEVSGNEPVVFEGVTAAQFDDAMQSISEQMAYLNAESLVLVAAILAVFGALCVQTLIRAITWQE